MMCKTLKNLKGFTLVEIMIVVAILGLLIAIGVPGFLTARNRARVNTEYANLKAINDNIASYGVNESKPLLTIASLWPASSVVADPASYIRRQLFCPINGTGYSYISTTLLASCLHHGSNPTVADLST